MKMYPDCFRITKARRSIPSSVRYQTWGITWSGRCLISKDFGVPQSRKRVYLVGYLDERCAGKIYLSREQTEHLLYKSFRAVKGAGSTPPKE